MDLHCVFSVHAGISVNFTHLFFNATENENVPVCTVLSGSTLERNVIVTLQLSSTEGKYVCRCWIIMITPLFQCTLKVG